MLQFNYIKKKMTRISPDHFKYIKVGLVLLCAGLFAGKLIQLHR